MAIEPWLYAAVIAFTAVDVLVLVYVARSTDGDGDTTGTGAGTGNALHGDAWPAHGQVNGLVDAETESDRASDDRDDRETDGDSVACPDCGVTNERGYRYCWNCLTRLPSVGDRDTGLSTAG